MQISVHGVYPVLDGLHFKTKIFKDSMMHSLGLKATQSGEHLRTWNPQGLAQDSAWRASAQPLSLNGIWTHRQHLVWPQNWRNLHANQSQLLLVHNVSRFKSFQPMQKTRWRLGPPQSFDERPSNGWRGWSRNRKQQKTILENPCLEFQELRLQEIRALHQTCTRRSHFGATERKAGLLWIGSFFKSILGAKT